MATAYWGVSLAFFMVLGMYALFFSQKSLYVPQLSKETINPSSLYSKFESLYPKQEKTEEKPPNVRLLATAVGSVRLALAEVNGSPQTLRVGSQVGSYRVESIERNYIVLLKGQNRLAIGFDFSPPQPQVQASQKAEAPVPQSSKSLQASLPKGELERLTADPGIMFRQIRLVPYVQDGKTKGFLFEWVEPGSLFEKAGIRAGDVLLSINNQEIKSGEDAFRILQVLRNESSIKLSLQRGNELIDLSLRVE